jgi:hypothetical protein
MKQTVSAPDESYALSGSATLADAQWPEKIELSSAVNRATRLRRNVRGIFKSAQCIVPLHLEIKRNRGPLLAKWPGPTLRIARKNHLLFEGVNFFTPEFR